VPRSEDDGRRPHPDAGLSPAGCIKELKRAVLDDEAPTVSFAVAEAVNDWLVRHKRPPVA
jgi:hypothetical protein